MAESTILEDIVTGITSRQCRYFKAKILDGHKADETNRMLKKVMDGKKVIVFSGKSTVDTFFILP